MLPRQFGRCSRRHGDWGSWLDRVESTIPRTSLPIHRSRLGGRALYRPFPEVTNTELAAQLGISRQATAKLVARGMPRDSVTRAQAWRRRNTGSRIRKDISPAKALAELEAEGEELPTDSVSLDEQLSLIQKVRRAAARRYDEAIEAREDDSARRWAQVVLSLSQRGADAELKLRRAREIEGQTISFKDAEAVFLGILKDIRKHTDAMPASLAGKVNPHDTALACQILTDWRVSFYRMMHAGASSVLAQPKREAGCDVKKAQG